MPVCPQCRGEYRPEITTCATCQVALIPDGHEIPPNPFASAKEMAQMLAGRETVPLFAGSSSGLDDLRDQLAGQQVPCVIIPVGGTDCGGRIHLRLHVLVEDAERAFAFFGEGYRPLVTDDVVPVLPDQQYEDDEEVSCPCCGHSLAGHKGNECPDCGLTVFHDE